MIIHDTTTEHGNYRKPPRPERGTATTHTEVELPSGGFAHVETTWRFRVWYDGPENGVEAELISRTPVVESAMGADLRDIEITDALRDEAIAAWESQHESDDEETASESARMDY